MTYRIGDGAWQTEPMTVLPGGQLAGTIPGAAIAPDAVIDYYLTAVTDGGLVSAPEVDPDQVPFRLTAG